MAGLVPGTRLTVYSLKPMHKGGGTVWVRAGNAWVNKDNSLNVYLDVLPLDGKLHCREASLDKPQALTVPATTQAHTAATTDLATVAVEGHS